MLLYCDDVSSMSSEQFNIFLQTMPVERREKTLRYVRDGDRVLGAAAYALLAYALYLNGCNINDYTLTTTTNGKPYLPGCPFEFNISHTDGAVACAVCESAVGVDVQKKTSRYQSVMKRVCTKNELEFLAQAENPADDFAKLWTLKESYVKCIGSGISDGLSQYDFASVAKGSCNSAYNCEFRTFDGGGYAVSVCSQKPIKTIRKIMLSELYGFIKN